MKYHQTDAEALHDFEGERLTKAEERAKSNSRRIDRLERLADEIGKQNENIARLVVQLEFTNKQLSAQESRLKEIEDRPKGRWSLVASAVITAVCSALAGAVATVIF